MAQHPSLPCAHSFVCVTEASGGEVAGTVTVEVPGRGRGISEHDFAYQVRWLPPSPSGFALLGLPTLGPSVCLRLPWLPCGWPHACLSLPTPVPTGPEGVFHLPDPGPQSRGHPSDPAWLQAPDWAAGGPPSCCWRPALSPVRAASSFSQNPCVRWRRQRGGMLGRPAVGERARSAPAESGQIFPKLGLLWEGGLQGHLWSSQWALREASGGPSGSCVLAHLPLVPPFRRLLEQQAERLQCETSPHPMPAALPVAVWFGATERRLQHSRFEYTSDPNVTSAGPTKSFLRCWAGCCMACAGGGGVVLQL